MGITEIEFSKGPCHGHLVTESGAPLTVGDVQRQIIRWSTERDLENAEGMIFANGRDAGVLDEPLAGGDVIRLAQVGMVAQHEVGPLGAIDTEAGLFKCNNRTFSIITSRFIASLAFCNKAVYEGGVV